MALWRPLHVLPHLAFLLLLSADRSWAKGKIIQLTEDNWSQILEGEWMVEFFAPWCPACKGLEPIWEEFADWSKDLGISVGQVDVTLNPGLSGRFMVTALPTIYHVYDSQFRQYRGSRDKDEFIGFIEEKKWQSLEEIPGWKTPNSFQMSLVSYFFKLSMILRSIHTKLIEEYGLPYWCSYLVFAIATILIGAILGLILVCIIDFVFPPKPPLPPAPGPVPANVFDTEKKRKEEEEVADDDDIEDDSIRPKSEELLTDEVRKRRTARKEK